MTIQKMVIILLHADISTRCSSLHQGNDTKHKAIMIFIYSAISPWDELSSLLKTGCYFSSGRKLSSLFGVQRLKVQLKMQMPYLWIVYSIQKQADAQYHWSYNVTNPCTLI